MNEELRQKGIENIMKQWGIRNNHLEFAGKVACLDEDDRVDAIDPIRNSISRYEVYMKEKFTNKEILEIIRQYNFESPNYIGNKNPLQLNFENGILRFNQPQV